MLIFAPIFPMYLLCSFSFVVLGGKFRLRLLLGGKIWKEIDKFQWVDNKFIDDAKERICQKYGEDVAQKFEGE